ncbi:capsular polysaccharide export protein, LipB/KpsS family [Methylobrevis albus]|uniref:Capsule polysaccharide biosynthesis protein n=1 Tax=Methylobrevis albus TaxID=2793297 RepID=A0A931MXS8_9HYPH|nr:hypothetical protein [Methylobrevis albus]MBH0239573.1 hypothetical protein [Methylobrevis albus]
MADVAVMDNQKESGVKPSDQAVEATAESNDSVVVMFDAAGGPESATEETSPTSPAAVDLERPAADETFDVADPADFVADEHPDTGDVDEAPGDAADPVDLAADDGADDLGSDDAETGETDSDAADAEAVDDDATYEVPDPAEFVADDETDPDAGTGDATVTDEAAAFEADETAEAGETVAAAAPAGSAEAVAVAAAAAARSTRALPALRTIWILGAPVELRPLIEAAMPDRVFRFLLTTQPLGERRDRIVHSAGACVAAWGDARTSDLEEFIVETGVPFARLGPAGLLGPATGGPGLTPYGFYLDKTPAPPALGSSAVRTLRPSQMRTAAETARLQALLDAYLKAGVTLANPGCRGVAPPRSTRRSVLIVADEQDGLLAPASAKRFAGYGELVRIARERFPGWEINFVTNFDYFIPDAVVSQVVAGVDNVIHAPYSPQLLGGCEAVLVHNSFAGFDAAARGISVVAIGDTDLARGLAEKVPPLDLFAAVFADGVHYVDPVSSRAIELSDAIGLIAARAAQKTPVKPRVSAAWREPVARAPAAPAAPKPQPSAAAPVSIKKLLANLRVPDKKALTKEQATQPRPAEGVAHMVVPNWLAAEPAGEVPTGRLVGLDFDLRSGDNAFVPKVEAVIDLVLNDDADVSVSARRVANFAAKQPELFLRLVRGRLSRFGARAVVIRDLRNPAVRFFARAAGSLGVPRIYLPMNASDMLDDEERLQLESLSSLADLVLAWDEGYGALLEQIGYPADRILAVDAGVTAAVDASANNSILVSLGQRWERSRSEEPKDADDFIVDLIELADAFGYGVAFHLGKEFLKTLPDRGLQILQSVPNVTFEIEGAELRPFDELLLESTVVLCDSRAIQRRVQQIGLLGVLLARDAEAVPAGRNICRNAAEVRSALAASLDNLPAEGGPATGSDAEALDEVLGELLSGARTVTVLPPPEERLLSGGKVPFAVVSSTVPLAELQRTQRHLLPMIGARRWVRTTAATALSEMIDIDLVVQWGIRSNVQKEAVDLARRRLGIGRLLLEDGFIRSINIGLSGDPTLSVTMDDMTPFYDATQPSRLETILNDKSFALTPDQKARSRAAIELITSLKVTKYNFAPYRRLDLGAPERKKILVVDQRGGDQSIESGLASPTSFQAMVMAAIELSRDHDVIIKTHPDANIGGKDSAIGLATLESARNNPAVTVVTDDMNPYSLIDVVDKVFVVTSGLGFEALMAGKEVWCFGVPFYAGWGLTKDRVKVPRRTAKRTIEDLFHTFYITLSRYFDPVVEQPCEVERVVQYIADIRPWRMPDETLTLGAAVREEAGALSPAELPTPLQEQPLAADATIWALNFSPWKREYLQNIFSNHRIEFVDAGTSIQDISGAIRGSNNPAFVVWGRSTRPGLSVLCRRWSIPVYRMEDGFVRSVGLGADKVLPYSFCLDSRGIYFDATQPSDLEVVLSSFDFAAEPDLVEQAATLREMIVARGLSKYNFPYPSTEGGPFGPKRAKRVLVIGQVEDDASIEFGGPPGGVSNNDLVRLARAENPDAQVIYKIHPDVLAGRRAYNSDPADVAGICEISSGPLSMHDAFHEVDHVYTITSLAGFEALMRGIKVTTVGAPFYAGWGLTDTRMATPRRNRQLTIDQLFAGAYLLYAKYCDPKTGAVLDLRTVIEEIESELQLLADPVFDAGLFEADE